MIRASFALAGTVLAAIAHAPAQAQTQPQAANILARACTAKGEQEIDEADIGEALLIEAGISPTDFVRQHPVPASSDDRTLSDFNDAALIARIREVRDEQGAINGGINNLEQYLNYQPEEVTVERGPVSLFVGSTPWKITCKAQDPPRPNEADPTPPARFAIRETPEELWLTGKKRDEAGAFSIGFERSRSTLDDGTVKTATSFTIDGTVGLRLTPDSSRNFHTYLFATYNLDRDRTRPAPTLGPGESESDGDTNALALGVAMRFGGFLGDFPLDANLQASTVFDFANDASRFRLRGVLTPRPFEDLGICGLNGFNGASRPSESTRSRLRGRCIISAEAEAAWVMRRGTTELGNYDTFLAIGARGGIEFFLPTSRGNESGLLAGITYRYLPVVHGPSDDIERFEANFGHRFWTGDVGIDVGFTYARGNNELTLEEEDKLTFGIGLVY
jgi:hypothetical protein